MYHIGFWHCYVEVSGNCENLIYEYIFKGQPLNDEYTDMIYVSEYDNNGELYYVQPISNLPDYNNASIYPSRSGLLVPLSK